GSTGLGPALWIEVGALQLVGSGVRRARLSISSKPDFDRLYQVLTDSNFKSTLELRSFATAGRRTWRQVVLGGLVRTTQAVALKEKQVFYADVANKKVPEGSVAPIGPAKIALAEPMNLRVPSSPQLSTVAKMNIATTKAMQPTIASVASAVP